MKYLTTKLSVQHLSITDFINIIQNLYQLDKIALVPYIVSFDGGKLYCMIKLSLFKSVKIKIIMNIF